MPEEKANAVVLPDIGALTMGSNKRKIGGLSSKIRGISMKLVSVCVQMYWLSSCRAFFTQCGVCVWQDELQRDLMQERWDLVEQYPAQLRSFVPVLTTYTDSAFPTDAPTDKGLRVALRYEVGRFFAALERLRQATSRQALNEAYIAYGDMSLHFDRYLRVGGLYTYYDDSISTEPYFEGISEKSLVYSDPVKDPADVRDLVILCKGADKGKTGILIAVYPDGRNNCVVKLDKYKGIREIRVVPRAWVAKRLGEQDPDEAFLIPRNE